MCLKRYFIDFRRKTHKWGFVKILITSFDKESFHLRIYKLNVQGILYIGWFTCILRWFYCCTLHTTIAIYINGNLRFLTGIAIYMLCLKLCIPFNSPSSFSIYASCLSLLALYRSHSAHTKLLCRSLCVKIAFKSWRCQTLCMFPNQ